MVYKKNTLLSAIDTKYCKKLRISNSKLHVQTLQQTSRRHQRPSFLSTLSTFVFAIDLAFEIDDDNDERNDVIVSVGQHQLSSQVESGQAPENGRARLRSRGDICDEATHTEGEAHATAARGIASQSTDAKRVSRFLLRDRGNSVHGRAHEKSTAGRRDGIAKGSDNRATDHRDDNVSMLHLHHLLRARL